MAAVPFSVEASLERPNVEVGALSYPETYRMLEDDEAVQGTNEEILLVSVETQIDTSPGIPEEAMAW